MFDYKRTEKFKHLIDSDIDSEKLKLMIESDIKLYFLLESIKEEIVMFLEEESIKKHSFDSFVDFLNHIATTWKNFKVSEVYNNSGCTYHVTSENGLLYFIDSEEESISIIGELL